MITSIDLCDLNSVVIPRLGFTFFKFSFQISKINNFKCIKIRSCLLSGKLAHLGGRPGQTSWPTGHELWPLGPGQIPKWSSLI
jgi:hypothetical protein